MQSTNDFSQEIAQLKRELDTAQAIVIGAGAGLSTAAGLEYSGERFQKHFADFINKYHYSDMYTAGWYPYETPEEYWAFWSRHILLDRYEEDGGELYRELLRVVSNKEYFVITTNVDHCFQRAGIDKKRLFYTQGDYGLWQCETPCHQKTYDNEEPVRRMVAEQKDMHIPSELIPYCPRCSKPMIMNLRGHDRFVQDEGWHAAAKRYEDFLNKYSQEHILFWELGVGGNTPGIIKYPFWQMTYENPLAVYACVNKGEAVVPPEILGQSLSIDADIAAVIGSL